VAHGAWIRGLNNAERAALTEAMLYSGEVVDLSDLPGKKVDNTPPVESRQNFSDSPPIVAGGINVPMISGRGLATPAELSTNSNPFRFQHRASLQNSPRPQRMWNGIDWPDRGNCSGGQKIYALRDATSLSKISADLRLHHEQETAEESTRWCWT